MTASAFRGPAEPAVVLVYAPSKAGKTTDTLYSFPRALFLALPGALKPAAHVLGFQPEARAVTSMADATAEIRKVKPGAHDAIVVDDLSLLAERSQSTWEKRLSGHTLWGQMRDDAIELRDAARAAGMHVIFSAHEMGPRLFGTTSLRGGPRLPGRMVEDFPAVCDTVLRAQPEPERPGWPWCYRCSAQDTQYVTGDRHGVVPDRAPMNLGEILRAAGFVLRRAPGLEWQDDVVASVAALLARTPPEKQTATLQAVVAGMKKKGRPDLHIRWVLRDALDRIVLERRRQTAAWAGFGL